MAFQEVIYKWNHVLANLGTRSTTSKGQLKVIQTANLLAFTIALITLPYVGIFYWSGSTLLGQLTCFIVLGYFLTPILNKFGFLNFSRILMSVVGNIAVTSYSIVLGRDAGIHLYYFALVSYPFLAFELKEKRKVIVSLMLPVFLYTLLEWKFFPLGPWITLNPNSLKIVYYNIVFSCTLTLIAAFFYFSYTNKTTEGQLELSLKKLQSILNNVNEIICLIDRDFRFKFANHSLIQYGMAPDSILNKTIFEILPPEEANFYAKQYQDVFTSKQIKTLTTHFTNPDGEIKWHHLTLVPIKNEDSQINELIIISRDMTEEQKITEKLKLAKTEAENANRIKDEFLATLSHELRTPLTSILAWTQLLRSKKLTQEKELHGINILEQSAKAQGQLINDLLDISRIKAGKFFISTKKVNLIEIMTIALDSIRSIADKKLIQIEFVKDPTVKNIVADPIRLQQIFWNLLSNSIKFTPKGGKIWVEISRKNASSKDEKIQIQIRDTGKGIKAEFLPHLFKRFSQDDSSSTRNYSGLGLGLAIVRSLVEMHGGTITAESAGENQGATFTITFASQEVLNASHDTAQTENKLKESDPFSFHLNGLKLLVVDDDQNTRESISFMLESLGAQVKTASSAQEGLTILEATPPDVLISDIAMPYEDGYEFILKIRKLDSNVVRNIPAVALTAYAGNEDVQRALSAGFNAHISKPVDSFELSRMLIQLVKRTRKEKELE